MRNSLVIFATLAATTTIAAAEPPGLTASVAPEAPASSYVGVGILFGGDIGLDGQLDVEGGYHLNGAWWLHGMAAGGVAGDDQGGGVVHQARVGIEARGCRFEGIACAYAGADLGYQAFTWHSNEGDAMNEQHDDVLASLRVGADIGGRHLRVRPGIESSQLVTGRDTYSRAPGTLVALNLSLGIAYRW